MGSRISLRKSQVVLAAALRAGRSWDHSEALTLNSQDKELVNDEGEPPPQVAAGENAVAIVPRLSLGGKSLVFCTILDPESDLHKKGTPLWSDVWIINLGGTGRPHLMRSQFDKFRPVWFSDSPGYFVSSRGHRGDGKHLDRSHGSGQRMSATRHRRIRPS